MLNDLTSPLLGKPSLYSPYCVVCGKPATNQHHVVIKGIGGSKHERRIPTVSLCGMGGVDGCHGKAHAMRLHFRWDGGWWCLETDEPCSYAEALEMDGWSRITDRWECDGC